MTSKLLGIVTEVKEEKSSKALSPMLMTPSSITTEVIEEAKLCHGRLLGEV